MVQVPKLRRGVSRMTKKHFIAAADMVLAIKNGEWPDTLPQWALYHSPVTTETELTGNIPAAYVQAVWTADAFINLFTAYNSRFDRNRFLMACGLADAPAKAKKARTR
jgi:hypothetical protein